MSFLSIKFLLCNSTILYPSLTILTLLLYKFLSTLPSIFSKFNKILFLSKILSIICLFILNIFTQKILQNFRKEQKDEKKQKV